MLKSKLKINPNNLRDMEEVALRENIKDENHFFNQIIKAGLKTFSNKTEMILSSLDEISNELRILRIQSQANNQKTLEIDKRLNKMEKLFEDELED